MIFKPEQQAFFELTTERLPDRGARFEARNPSMPMERFAMREQINALLQVRLSSAFQPFVKLSMKSANNSRVRKSHCCNSLP
jgi:hypothetical protein